MNEIRVNDYIEGLEYYGHKIRKVRGWVDKISADIDGIVYWIQADDNYKGHRGTGIFVNLGEVVKLEDKPRPIL